MYKGLSPWSVRVGGIPLFVSGSVSGGLGISDWVVVVSVVAEVSGVSESGVLVSGVSESGVLVLVWVSGFEVFVVSGVVVVSEVVSGVFVVSEGWEVWFSSSPQAVRRAHAIRMVIKTRGFIKAFLGVFGVGLINHTTVATGQRLDSTSGEYISGSLDG